jgi:hypothetical protein
LRFHVIRVVLCLATVVLARGHVQGQTGLVSAYSFDENGGSMAGDASGQGHPGTIAGATWNAAGRFGSALSFNGTNSWVTVADAASLDLTTGMTLEAWVKPTALSSWRTVVMKETAGDLAYVLYAYDNAPRPAVYINVSGQVSTSGGTAPALNAWTHLAATYDGASLRLFTNGVLVSNTAKTGAMATSANPLRIGGNGVWGEYYSGLIDEVRVYNRALSQAEIQTDMATPIGSGGPPPPDTTPPTVGLTQPANGATVSGTTTVTASASDNVGVAGVQFKLDGENLGAEVSVFPYSLSWDTSSAAAGGHSLTAVGRDGAGNQTTSAARAVTVNNGGGSSLVGQWSAPMELGVVAVNMVMMHTGKVLMYSGEFTSTYTERVLDPNTGAITLVPNPYYNLFCSGHAQLADGRILVVGGYAPPSLGSAEANIFDPVSLTWTKVPNMSYRRWYPSATTLGDGRVLVTSGGQTCLTCLADIPEIYNPATNSWTRLTGASWAMPYYPFTYLLPDGRVLDAGANEAAVVTRALDVATQTWTTIDPVVVDGHSSAMYLPGKIIKSGTGTDSGASGTVAATAYVLDMTSPSPAWRQIPSMAFARAYHNTTLLPDGSVLVTGGGSRRDGKNEQYAVKQAELWSPVTETWTTLAQAATPRLYHSSALLLPDARVLVAGSGNDSGMVDRTAAEIFSPPYLFRGARPTIGSVPSVLSYATDFLLQTADAAGIASVALIRPAAVTHSFDEDQRFVPLTFVRNGGSLTIQSPANANLAPPGYYMLFIVNSNGVPSTAAWVQFAGTAQDTQPPSAPVSLAAQPSFGTAALSWTASTDNTGVARYNVHRSTTSGFTPGAVNKVGEATAASYVNTGLAAGTYYFVITAQDVAGNVSGPSNEAVALVPGDTTAPSVAMTAPAGGSMASWTLPVSAIASDDVGVASVQFTVDGAAVGSADTSAPFTIQWNSSTVPNGLHAISAVARDAAGNLTAATAVMVDVSNTQPSPNGLVAAYSFNEAAGVSTLDASGNSNTGTIANATRSTAGKFGNALLFNGTSARVNVPDAASLDLTTGMTLEAWVRPSALASWRTVILKETTGGLAFSLYAHTTGSRPEGYVHVTTDTAASGTSALALNTWTHLSVSYDGVTIRLYVNGVQVGSRALTGPIATSTGALRIGGNAVWGEYFKGLIDEVRVYNRALSAGEIQLDMVTPIP